MSFLALKVAWFILQPSSFLVLLFVLGFILIWRGFPRAGQRIVFSAALLYCVLGLTPVGNWLMLPLEDRYQAETPPADQQPAGIIVLGGAIDTMVAADRPGPAFNEAAERMTEAVLLANRYPQAKLIFTGGQTEILYSGVTEASAALKFFTSFGVDPARMIFEDKSRTTYENAMYTRALTTPQPRQRWMLVTSAFHMSRAMGCFRAQGFDVMPWPVDYRTRGPKDWLRFFPRPSEGLRRVDLAVKEWISLFLHRIAGITTSFLP
jgi:uncharacterized SAM-binding protein YcdF (DUF218 family)